MKSSLVYFLFTILVSLSSANAAEATSSSSNDDLTRPSISYKPSPAIETWMGTDNEGNPCEYAAEVQYTNKTYESNDDLDLVKRIEVCVTSYEDCYDEKIEGKFLSDDDKIEIRDDMINAMKEVKEGVEISQLKSELRDFAQKKNEKYDESVYTVTDLFDLSVDMKTLHEIGGPCNFVQITFKNEAYRTYAKENTLFLHRDSETKTWKMAEFYEITNEGYAKVRFGSLCPVAILQIDQAKAAKAEEDNTPCPYVWAMFGILMAYVVSVVIMTFAISDKSLAKTLLYTVLSAAQIASTCIVGYFCIINMHLPVCIVLVSLNIVAFAAGIYILFKKIL